MTAMNLLITATSPYARVARIALRELGLNDACEQTIVKSRTPENETNEYNPTGKVPTLLVTNGPVLSETRMICCYLQGLAKRTDFVSANNDVESHVLEGVAIGFVDGVSVWLREVRRPESDRSQDILRQELERSQRCVQWLNERASELPESVNFCSATLLVALESLSKVESTPWQDGAAALATWAEKLGQQSSIAQTYRK